MKWPERLCLWLCIVSLMASTYMQNEIDRIQGERITRVFNRTMDLADRVDRLEPHRPAFGAPDTLRFPDAGLPDSLTVRSGWIVFDITGPVQKWHEAWTAASADSFSVRFRPGTVCAGADTQWLFPDTSWTQHADGSRSRVRYGGAGPFYSPEMNRWFHRKWVTP